MRIGIVTTWFERGAAYVSRTYMELFQKLGHEVLVYARGGDGNPDKNSVKWNEAYVTRDEKFNDTRINIKKFIRWINNTHLDMVFFNEQQHFLAPAIVKKRFPNLLVASYIDYYTEDMLPLFGIYDFVICNTYRHLQAMKNHPQAYYLKWGVDSNLYKPKQENDKNKQVVFFHSVGMSKRKGTDILVDSFIESHLYKKSKLIIHSQIPIDRVCGFKKEELQGYNIDVIERTVEAPGLYSLGDVYVYPTRLDGLGLTMYEAMASGLPVITTDYPPMNEVITEDVGSLIKVADHYCRSDAYYYPMSICDKGSLIEKMREYVDNPLLIKLHGNAARERAIKDYSLDAMTIGLSAILDSIKVRPIDSNLYQIIRKKYGSPIISFLKNISESNNRLKKVKGIITKLF